MDKEQLIQGIIEFLAKAQRPSIKDALHNHPDGLSRAQAGLLFLLFYHKKVTAKQIAEHLGISKSAATQLVDPLLDKGLVSRQVDEHDRRIAWLNLTAKGSAALKKLSSQKFAGLRGNLNSLSHSELETLYKLHKKMAAANTKEKND